MVSHCVFMRDHRFWSRDAASVRPEHAALQEAWASLCAADGVFDAYSLRQYKDDGYSGFPSYCCSKASTVMASEATLEKLMLPVKACVARLLRADARQHLKMIRHHRAEAEARGGVYEERDYANLAEEMTIVTRFRDSAVCAYSKLRRLGGSEEEFERLNWLYCEDLEYMKATVRLNRKRKA